MGRKTDVIARLARVQGQVRGLSAMIEDEREAADILTVLSSIRAALDGVGALVLTQQVEEALAVSSTTQELTWEETAERVERVKKALARFVS